MLTSTEPLTATELTENNINPPAQEVRRARLLDRISPVEARSQRVFGMLIAIAIAVGYLAVLLCYFAPANGEVDQNGYLVGGRRYLETWSTGYKPANDFTFIGNMWVRADDGTNFPKYPLGLSMLYAASLKIFGAGDGTASIYAAHDFGVLGVKYAFLISPIGAALAVLGTYFVARNMAGVYASLCAMLLFGFSQTVLMLANNPNSHASCVAFVVWGMALLIKHWNTGSIWRGILAGIFLGFAMTIRYTEGLLALPVAIVAISMIRCRRFEWSRLIPLLLLIATVALYLVGVPVINQFSVFVPIAVGLAFLTYRWTDGFKQGIKWHSFDSITTTCSLAVLMLPLLSKSVYTGLSSNLIEFVLAVGLSGLFAVLIFINDFKSWRAWITAAMPTLGWLIPVGYLIAYNVHFMGTWTGYDTTKESAFGAAFTWDHVWENWEKMLRQINGAGMFFVLPIGILGVLVLFRRSRLLATVMLAWIFPCVAIYTAYYWAPDWGSVSYLRFFVTIFPAICVGAACVFRELRQPIVDTIQGSTLKPILITTGMSLAMLGTITIGHLYLTGYTYDRLLLCTIPTGIVLIGAVWLRQYPLAMPMATGLVVALTTGVGTYRAIYGIEGGVETGQSMEVLFRTHINLAGLSQVVADKVPAKSVVFSMSGELHFLQFLKNYECFRADAFRTAFKDEINRSLDRTGDGSIADPLQPSRFKFLQSIYNNKSDKDLIAVQNSIMDTAFAENRKVFAVLEADVVTEFMRKFAKDKNKYTTKIVGYYNDMPKVMDYNALPETDKKAKSTNPRKNWNNRPKIMGERSLQHYQIVEIMPAVSPTTVPSTKPTSRPATQPAKS